MTLYQRGRVSPDVDVLLSGGPDAGLEARRAVHAGDGSLPAAVREDLGLLVSELVSNAVLRMGSEQEQSVRVSVRRQHGLVRVEVADSGQGSARAHACARPDESGDWSLLLLDRIAPSWGVKRSSTGTSVWFEIGADQ